MKRCAPLLAAVGLVLGGCAYQVKQTPSDRPVVLENARDYDAFVERRTDDLVRMGAFKDRKDAASAAQDEAEQRFGPRAPSDSASWGWTTAGRDRSPSVDELNATLGKNR